MLATYLRSTFSKGWPGNMFSGISALSTRNRLSKLPAFQEKEKSKIAEPNPRILKYFRINLS